MRGISKVKDISVDELFFIILHLAKGTTTVPDFFKGIVKVIATDILIITVTVELVLVLGLSFHFEIV